MEDLIAQHDDRGTVASGLAAKGTPLGAEPGREGAFEMVHFLIAAM